MRRPSAFVLITMSACFGCDNQDDNGPDIPHAIATESDESCKACHANGIDNAPELHGENSGCVSCHNPTTRVTATPIPHEVADPDDAACLGCHGSADQGAGVTSHPGWPRCTSCHQEAQ